MRIAEIDLSTPEKTASEIKTLCDLGMLGHAEIKEAAKIGKYSFPHSIGNEFSMNVPALIREITSKNMRVFFIYDDRNVIVGYSAWKIGHAILNSGYKSASMGAVYIPKELRKSGDTVKKLFMFCAETLKKEGLDTFIITNEGTVLDKAVSKMGLPIYAKEYRI